ncbi:hypothetical protein RLIN73S_02188 [Rhodanobacter lindaniclasticus]
MQGGDCAESFADCTSPAISNRLKVLLAMSLVLVYGLKKRVLRVGRFAGQYAEAAFGGQRGPQRRELAEFSRRRGQRPANSPPPHGDPIRSG